MITDAGFGPGYKLPGLEEKKVLKEAARGYVPDRIIDRRKQPYRAPDAVSFLAADAPGYVGELLSERSVKEAGMFNSRAVRMLVEKCRRRSGTDTFSNSDNMAFVGILSAQLLYTTMIAGENPPPAAPLHFTVDNDTLQ